MTDHINSMLLESHGSGIVKQMGKVYNARDWTILLNSHQTNGNFNNITVNIFLDGLKKERHKCTAFVKYRYIRTKQKKIITKIRQTKKSLSAYARNN